MGFSTVGCGDNIGPDMYGTPMPEYGTPLAVYSVKGKVTDASRPGVGVEGIRMIFGYPDADAYARKYDDTVFTASDGTYKYVSRPRDFSNALTVWLKDVDGEANGVFKSDMAQVSFYTDEWGIVDGMITKTDVNFALEPGQDPDE